MRVGTEDDAGAVLGPLAEAADAKAMKKLDNKFRLLSCNRRNEEATKSPDGERLGEPGP